MAKYKRMINCDFVNASSFKLKISNRAKLLYFFMLSNADDKGFVDNVDEQIELLDSNDRKFNNQSNMTLLPDNFETSLQELLDRGLLYKFSDKHKNSIYLIKHWYCHNNIPKDRVRDSSYEKYLENYFVNEDGEYQLCSKCNTDVKQLCPQIKENKSKVNIISNTKVSKDNQSLLLGKKPNAHEEEENDDDKPF